MFDVRSSIAAAKALRENSIFKIVGVVHTILWCGKMSYEHYELKEV
jgi:hypothetical protein